MESIPDNMDLRMEKALKSWAEQGGLTSGKSAQLHEFIAELAHQERKRRLTRTACGFAAAVMACIWLLFASCPVAAAAYLGGPIPQPQIALSQVLCFTAVLTCFFLNQISHYPASKSFEVNYE
ncbi:hypothetical protein ASZ90_018214 [hydrocarbon metagenome]|uniref:Uncharacterized protein n=1 Tax=hydrocarbon metagenome TaxID=938273 RepID=A0A0W8E6W8_9ZZZZ